MKKLTFVFGIFFAGNSVFAITNNVRFDGRPQLREIFSTQNLSPELRLETQKAENYKEALQKRHRLEIKKRIIETPEFKNLHNQKVRHAIGKNQNNVDEVQTFLKRDGELDFVPFYDEMRPKNEKSMIVPNAKQYFRKCAMQYYGYGRYCNQNTMMDGVIFGSEHRVDHVPYWLSGRYLQMGDKFFLTEGLKNRYIQGEKIPTGYQRSTYRRGGSGGNILNQFTEEWEALPTISD